MAPAASLRLQSVRWDAVAERELAPAVAHDAVFGLRGARFLAGAPDGVLLGCYVGPTRVGTLLLRIDGTGEAPELCLVAAGGAARHINLTHHVLPMVERWAVTRGCKTVRWHATRPAARRVAERYGYKPLELVLRKELVPCRAV